MHIGLDYLVLTEKKSIHGIDKKKILKPIKRKTNTTCQLNVPGNVKLNLGENI